MTKTLALLPLLLLMSAPFPASANHWPAPFEYLNGTAPRDPDFWPCPREIAVDAECAVQFDGTNNTNDVSYHIVRKNGVIIRVVRLLPKERSALTIYPKPEGFGEKK